MVHSGGVSDDDLRCLARLHAATLPISTLSTLGEGTLERYYEIILESEIEHLFFERRDGRIVAGAVLSLEPSGSLGRLVKRSPLAFGLELAQAFIRSGSFRRQVLQYMRERLAGEQLETDLPEVVQIFTDPAYRNQSLGRLLVEQVEQFLRSRKERDGEAEYMIRTFSENNDAAIGFYRRRGFTRFAVTVQALAG